MKLNKKQVKRYIKMFKDDGLIKELKGYLSKNYCYVIYASDYDFYIEVRKNENDCNCIYNDEIRFIDYYEILKNNNYYDNKRFIVALAIDYSNNREYYDDKYGWYDIVNWFYDKAKKYGLLKVFKENAIC